MNIKTLVYHFSTLPPIENENNNYLNKKKSRENASTFIPRYLQPKNDRRELFIFLSKNI
jgi:hypothetical protein